MALALYRTEDCSGPDGVSIDGRPWSDGYGEWVVSVGSFKYQSNEIRNGSVGSSPAVAYDSTLPASLADQRIEADIIGDGHQLIGRYNVGASNYYLAYKIGTAVYLYRVDSGVSTYLASGGWSGGATGRLKLDIQGTTIKVYEGASQRISHVDATYATGVCGIRIVVPIHSFDNIDVYIDESLVTTPAPTSFPDPTTPAPSTAEPTTAEPTTAEPTTPGPTTATPTTLPEPTFPIVTTGLPPTTAIGSTTGAFTTAEPTTPPPTSFFGTTEPPTTGGTFIRTSVSYVDVMDQLVVRAWIENEERKVRDEDLDVSECSLVILDENGVSLPFGGLADALGGQYVRFVIPSARLYANHLYMLESTLVVDLGPTIGPSAEPFPVIA